ncbi:hypothetical protein BST37_17015 [Mycobacterium noviomagense]|nr:hypothetical protein BST37_17015 [Mycobacterium noviomagense]
MGVSMAPENVRMVLVEGENADGATVEEDTIPISTDGNNQEPATLTAPNQVVSAILGTRESATQGGHQVTSTGVTWTDPAEAAALRDLLAAHKMENVMLVSAFLSAAALTQTVGNAVGYDHTALLFVEPDTATLAVVDTADGSVTDVQTRQLPADDEAAVAALTEMVAGAEVLDSRPDGIFVVGSDVDVAKIKPQLEAATSLLVNAPDEPEMALARGAALASAHAPLFESSTAAQAYAQVPGAGVVEPGAPAEATMAAPGYAAFVGQGDYDATEMTQALAYSADPDSAANAYTAVAGAEGAGLAAADAADVHEEERPTRKPFVVALGVLTIFVVGVAALAIALALDIRPKVNDRPNLGQRMVVPTNQAPAPPQAPAPTAPAPAAPAPAPAAPAPPAPAPAAPAPALPAPPPVAPAPPPVAPPPAPVAPPQLPVPANPIPAPNVPGPGIPGPNIPGPPVPGIGHGGGGPGIPGLGGGGIPGIPHF